MSVLRQIEVQYVPLSMVRKWNRNPKAHDLEAIKASIAKFGFVDPLIMDEASGQLVAGHGRLDALVELYEAEGEFAPTGIHVDDDSVEWKVPVLRGIEFGNPQEAEAYLLASNKLVERGGWDRKALHEVLDDLGDAGLLEITGFTLDEFEDIVALIGIPEMPDEEFKGGYAETPAELAAREQHGEEQGAPNMKEIVILLSQQAHEAFVFKAQELKKRWDLPNLTETIVRAVVRAHDSGE